MRFIRNTLNEKPFLKWAGGKMRIIDKIRESLPDGNRLIEPFVGAGSVFLNVNFDNFLLADINQDLINLFIRLKLEQNEFIDFCRQFFVPELNTQSAFYSLRSEFNSTKDIRLKSALFLYLNRHAYNGLVRYNNSGQFNTAFGAYKNPYFPENEMQAFIKKSQNAIFECADYRTIMEKATYGDVVYCDPPYVPISTTASFTKYYTDSFIQEDQEQLAELARKLADKGIPVIISNHDTEFTQNLYQGSKIVSFDVQRNISCIGNTRTQARELIAVFN